MNELLILLKDASPFVIAAVVVLVLGNQYLKVRAKEADAKAEQSKNEAVAEASRLEVARLLAEADARREAERSRVAAELTGQQTRLATELTSQRERLAAELEVYRRDTAVLMQNTASALASISENQRSAASLAITYDANVDEQAEGTREATAQNLSGLRDLFIMTFDMYMKDPPATTASIRRMQKALAEGKLEKAQAIVDEETAGAGDNELKEAV